MKIIGVDEDTGEGYNVIYKGCCIKSLCDGWNGEIDGDYIEVLNCNSIKLFVSLATLLAVAFFI